MTDEIIKAEDKSTMTDFEEIRETINLKDLILDNNLENLILNKIDIKQEGTSQNLVVKEFSIEYAIKEGENIWPFELYKYGNSLYNSTGKKDILNFIIKLKDIHCGENTLKYPNLICMDIPLKNDIFKQIIMENIIKASSLILKYYISFLLRFYKNENNTNKPLVDQYIAEEFGGIKKIFLGGVMKFRFLKNYFVVFFMKMFLNIFMNMTLLLFINKKIIYFF